MTTVFGSHLLSPRAIWPVALLAIAAWGCGGPLEDEHADDESAEEAATASSPVPGRGVTTPFGKPGSLWAAGYHTGDDYASPVGSRVVATRAGRVVAAGWNVWGAAYGKQVIIETDGIRHLYAHLSVISVSSGQRVDPGQKLGEVGVTGNTTGAHLHYEERRSPYGYYDHRKPVFNKGAAPAPTHGYKNWIYGRAHADIEGLQRALVSAGCDVADKYTRTYGASTRSAVTCFQRRQGWSGSDADGYMGPTSAARLFLVGDVYVDRLHRGVGDSDSVRMLQQRINEVRKTRLRISGSYDGATRDAVAAWQRSLGDRGAAADGNMGPIQSRALFPAHRYTIH